VARTFEGSDRRARRWSPTGLQNGISRIKRWYGGSPGYLCNNVSRFLHSCAYRPPNSTWFNIYEYFWTADSHTMKYGIFWQSFESAHPFMLNLFHCGGVNRDALTSARYEQGAPFDPLEEETFPRGYRLQDYDNPSAEVTTTDFAHSPENNPDWYYGNGGPETRAMRRLYADLENEPYNLLEHILREKRPYSELFTATYTRGREELELHYRTQAQVLPFYPAGFSPSAVDAPERDRMRTIDFVTMPGLPLNWFRTSYGTYDAIPGPSLKSRIDGRASGDLPAEFLAAGAVPPKRAAGILTMPAFLAPLGAAYGVPKMRTLASRYFMRLLCGMPNVYDPLGAGTEATHEKFMIADKDGPPNPLANETAQQHLDRKSECYQCHVNLDPLAQALSKHFMGWTQLNDVIASWGELDPAPRTNFDYSSSAYGIRNGGIISQGAFLGSEVTGVQGVARKLVSSPIWGSCVVKQVFENLHGRAITFGDVKLIKTLTDRFMRHQDYDLLVQETVDLPTFTRKD
jgi:hypothetical protein